VRQKTLIVMLFLICGLVNGCGGNDNSGPPPTSGAASIDTTTTTPAPIPDIVISNFTFAVRGPVKPGQQVIVVNKDDSSHSITADSGNAIDVRISGGGGTSTFTAPNTPGTYAFHCKYHANMHGSLTVE
jgi:cupredoxin-like protein